MIRIFDIIFAIIFLIILFPIIFVTFLLSWIDTRNPFFVQKRVGQKGKAFYLVKFRSMQLNTKSVGTHLVDETRITYFGKILRKTKLDELPQLWNVLKGEMSFVGPRPCLFSQKKLIKERNQRKVFDQMPGITGLAQLKGIDMSSPNLLAKTDRKMLNDLNLIKYFFYIIATFFLIFGIKFLDR